MVGQWRAQAQLGDAEESALVRHYDERRQELAVAMEGIAAEYTQRVAA